MSTIAERVKIFNKGKRENYNNKFRLMIERRIFSPDVQIIQALCTYYNTPMKADVFAKTCLCLLNLSFIYLKLKLYT